MDERLWHGGVPGLRPGDILRPGHSRDHLHPGCPFCAARAKGQSLAIVRPDGDPVEVDGPSAKEAVYVTRSKDYARFYASLYGYGDLYIVEPLGELTRSTEDATVEAYSCPEARVVSVYQRAIRLTDTQRRRYLKLFGKVPKPLLNNPRDLGLLARFGHG